MPIVRVNLPGEGYNVVIGKGVLKTLRRRLKKLNIHSDLAVITSPHVMRTHGRLLEQSVSGIRCVFITVSDDEKGKSQSAYLRLAGKLSCFEKKKQLCVLAFGGGVIGDAAGFAAGTYKRGIPYIQVPTTLLAQVDSSLGGKTGINTPYGKNLLGLIYQPKLVLSDLSLLKTLPLSEIRSGMAEVIKYGMIADKSLFEYVEKNVNDLLNLNFKKLEKVVVRCCKIKADIVAQDEKDDVAGRGIRAKLNFGHTVGHAMEAAGAYASYRHGEAIAVGMLAACGIAGEIGWAGEDVLLRLRRLIEKTGLPVFAKGLSADKILRHMSYDKKFLKGKNTFVLPRSIGNCELYPDVPESLVRKVLNRYLTQN